MKFRILLFTLSIFIMNTVTAQDLKTEEDKLSYAYGIFIAEQLKSQGVKNLNSEIVTAALKSQLEGTPSLMSAQEAKGFIGAYMQKAQASAGSDNKLAGEAYLAENKKRKEVTTTASGLQYEVLKSGSGATPTASSKVNTHYHGTLITGEVFDSSVERGEPISFPVNGVIAGWTEALQLMKVGDKWKLHIPSNLAYGERGAGGKIGPNAALVFEVELLGIE
jgi:FKBP-type peptidyl-prolyl cis-trans isomerase FklB